MSRLIFLLISLTLDIKIINSEFDNSAITVCSNSPCSEEELGATCQVYNEGYGCAQCVTDYFKLDVNHMCEDCTFIFGERCLFCQDINGCGQCDNGYDRIEDPATGLWYCQELDTNTPQQVTTFSQALLNMFAAHPEITDQSYYNSYINYCTQFDKLDLYPIDGSDNYDELALRYLRYISSQEEIIQLNSDFSLSMDGANITTDILQDMIDEIGIGDIGASSHYSNTFFSDLTDDERLERLGWGKEDNSTIRRLLVEERRRMQSSWLTAYAPGFWGSHYTDLRGFTTQVKDQDCGDCWSFAATGQFETNYHLATGQKVVFSEQHTLDCRNGGASCRGGSVSNFNDPLLDYVNRGLCTHEGFGNYVGYQRSCGSEPSCDADDTAYASAAIELSPWDDFRGATQWVSQNQGTAMTFGMWVPRSIFSLSSNWPYIIGCSSSDPIIGGHAMTIVGQYHSYTYDVDWLLVKNSWGDNEDWGMNGYAWVYGGAHDSCYLGSLPGTLGFAWNTFGNTQQFEFVCPSPCNLKDSTQKCKCEDNPNCRICHSSAGCEQCKPGYFQKTRRHKCESCSDTFGEGCMGCNNYHGCRQCKYGYHRFYDYDCGLWYCST